MSALAVRRKARLRSSVPTGCGPPSFTERIHHREEREPMKIRVPRPDPLDAMLAHQHGRVGVVQDVAAQMWQIGDDFRKRGRVLLASLPGRQLRAPPVRRPENAKRPPPTRACGTPGRVWSRAGIRSRCSRSGTTARSAASSVRAGHGKTRDTRNPGPPRRSGHWYRRRTLSGRPWP